MNGPSIFGTSATRNVCVITLGLLVVAAVFTALTLSTGYAAAQRPEPTGPVPAGQANQAAASPDCGSDWIIVPSANHGPNSNYLDGVSAHSANDIWAVGTYQGDVTPSREQTLILHWDGSAWSTVPSPDSSSTEDNYLYGVAAVSANNVWAVGSYNNGTTYRTLILHWDGTLWGLVSSPNHGTGSNTLNGVTAISANNAWAVGFYVNSSNVTQTLILHWNGSAWTTQTSLNPGTNSTLAAVSAASASDIWATGEYNDGNGTTDRTLILHWDGTLWALVPSPNVGTHDNGLIGVAALSSTNAWAVGFHVTNNSGIQTVILHWNGSAWITQTSPNPDPSLSELYGVAAVSANDAWAVGSYLNSSKNAYYTLIAHWDGSAWSAVPGPTPSTYCCSLQAIAPVSSTNVWAVGGYSGTTERTLILHDNPCTATPTPSPTPMPSLTTMPSPTSTPSQCALSFEDVPNLSTFYRYVQCLACRGIISGYACGGVGEPCDPNHDPYFRPNANVTRGQIAKIVALSANIHTPASGQTFQDVPPGSTFYTYTEQLYALQVMNGYPCGNPEPCVPPTNLPYFRPNSNATRGQLAKIDANAAGYNDPPSGQSFQDVPIGSTFYTYTQHLTSRGVMSGYACGGAGVPCVPPGNLPYFRPNADVTRGQTSKIVANTFYPNCQAP